MNISIKQWSLVGAFFWATISYSQVSIGVNSPSISAMLEVASTTKGLLLPRMSSVQHSQITTPTSGLMVWCTNCGQNGLIIYYNGYSWFDFNQNLIYNSPTRLSAQILNGSFILMWSAVTGATDYTLKYRTQGTENWTVINDGISDLNYYNFVTTTNNVNYEFAVAAISGINTSPYVSALGVSVPTTSSSVMHQILSTGQSLSVGAFPLLSLSQPFQNKMLNTNYSALVPLAGKVQGAAHNDAETISCGMANTITNLTLGSNQFNSVVSLCGVSGAKYEVLKKGTEPYTNGLNRMIEARNLCYQEGKPYVVAAVTTIHGEADTSTGVTAETYAGYLNQWQLDYETDAKIISGQSEGVPLFTDQCASWTKFGKTKPTVSLGQLKASIDNPSKIILVTPKYIFDYGTDGIHLNGNSQRRLGEYYGKVMKKVLVDHETWLPLSPSSVTRTNTIVTVTFNVPVAPLAFDTYAVAAKANYGFEYFDDSSTPPTITAVALAGPTSISITLSAIPTGGNKKIAYAYTGILDVGAGRNIPDSTRGNLRDSDTTPAYYQDGNVPNTMGNSLRNWCVTFIESVP
jgi:hypothetical protein